MVKNTRKLDAADLFCGAGGFTEGAVRSGRVDVRYALNHWQTAVDSHEENHPQTKHRCLPIDAVDPRNDKSIPDIDLLLASPECTHHSNARGGRPVCDQKRATPWHVLIWAEAKCPQWIIVENVREFRNWGPLDKNGRPLKSQKGTIFRQWVKALEAIGYDIDHQLLNAADFGAATKRIRLFIVARRRDVAPPKQDIPWPEPSHAQKDWRPAWSIIDWSKPCPSIFTRKRPLAEKTLRRIEIGLRKFCGPDVAEPFIVHLRGTSNVADIGQPTPTITAGGRHLGVAMPFILQAQGPGYNDASYKGVHDITEPMRTLLARNNHAVITPFLVKYHGGKDPKRDGTERQHGVDAPIPTIDTNPRFALAAPFMLAVNHGGDDDRSHSPENPLATLTTKNGHGIVQAFLTKNYGTAGAASVDDPLDTITTKDRFGLTLVRTMQELGIGDIGYRMLANDELARAQGFPEGYALHGNKAEVTKQIGNAVCPPVAAALCTTAAQHIERWG